jgi:multidrug efflux system outer membrane protein
MVKRFICHILLLAGVVLLLLPGCKVGPNYKRPDPVFDTTAYYRFDPLKGDTITNVKWWELFQDEQLHDLIRIALEENQNLLIATSRIEEARAFLGFTKADLYPNITVSGQATRNNFVQSINQQVDVRNTFFIAPALSWEIDFWGKLRRANEAAVAEMLATEYTRRAIQVSLISDVAALYFQLKTALVRAIQPRSTLTRHVSRNILPKEPFLFMNDSWHKPKMP